jgi:hypothetical protein
MGTVLDMLASCHEASTRCRSARVAGVAAAAPQALAADESRSTGRDSCSSTKAAVLGLSLGGLVATELDDDQQS